MHRLVQKISSAKLSMAMLSLGYELLKYNPNQPRVPRGQAAGGQWTSVAGKWDESRREDYELQYMSDTFQCRMMPWNPFCEDQAQSRMVACMKNNPIPPFFHVGRR